MRHIIIVDRNCTIWLNEFVIHLAVCSISHRINHRLFVMVYLVLSWIYYDDYWVFITPSFIQVPSLKLGNRKIVPVPVN